MNTKTIIIVLIIILICCQLLGLMLAKWGWQHSIYASPDTVGAVSGFFSHVLLAIRKGLAIYTWLEAQTQFHQGYDLICPSGESPLDAHRREEDLALLEGTEGEEQTEPELKEHKSEHHHEPGESHIEHPRTRKSLLRPYPLEHIHRTDSVKRMMPYYWLTTSLDPNFVRAYVNAAWWLTVHFKKPEEALAYLRLGLSRNPKSPMLYYSIGWVYFSAYKNYARAQRYFKKALQFPFEEEEDALMVRRFLCLALEKTQDWQQLLYWASKFHQEYPAIETFKRLMHKAQQELKNND